MTAKNEDLLKVLRDQNLEQYLEQYGRVLTPEQIEQHSKEQYESVYRKIHGEDDSPWEDDEQASTEFINKFFEMKSKEEGWVNRKY